MRQTSGTLAVARALRIVRAFTDARPEWTLAELSRELRLSKPTAFRLLGALELGRRYLDAELRSGETLSDPTASARYLKSRLGGYPYEVSSPGEVAEHLIPLGFTLERLQDGLAEGGNDVYLWRKHHKRAQAK